MSSTRKTADESVFNQSSFSSSPEFERGLLANLVAKRCALLDAPADRELIWFVQFLSHQEGGLAAVASDLLTRYADRIGTATMQALRKDYSANYTSDEVRAIRAEMDPDLVFEFALKGEIKAELLASVGVGEMAQFYRQSLRLEKHERQQARLDAERRRLTALADDALTDFYDSDWEREAAKKRDQAREQEARLEAMKHPEAYPAKSFRDLCFRNAEMEVTRRDNRPASNLERELAEMCLNPASTTLEDGGPWYFVRLVETLRDYQTEFVKAKSAGVVTELGRRVYDTLDFTFAKRQMTLMEGNARTGKSHAARLWCELHPGQARFVEVPPSNDEGSFYRALARGLGLGNFLNYKAAQIRERVESVLLSGDLLLVLDEAQRLWPQSNYRQAFPRRIVWVMVMKNSGVPIALISTQQFIETQKAVERTGWNSAQLTGRVSHYEMLPPQLERADLLAVAESLLPGAAKEDLKHMAVYACVSARGLAALEAISKRAEWRAERASRQVPTAEDIRAAMTESVIPSDTKLKFALAGKRAGASDQPGADAAPTAPSAPVPPVPAPDRVAGRNRVAKPMPAPAARRANLTELVPD
jgi:hypothetical protein